jgi:hypothetical protein
MDPRQAEVGGAFPVCSAHLAARQAQHNRSPGSVPWPAIQEIKLK